MNMDSCHFCGSRNISVKKDLKISFVYCSKCAAHGPTARYIKGEDYVAKAIKLWNLSYSTGAKK